MTSLMSETQFRKKFSFFLSFSDCSFDSGVSNIGSCYLARKNLQLVIYIYWLHICNVKYMHTYKGSKIHHRNENWVILPKSMFTNPYHCPSSSEEFVRSIVLFRLLKVSVHLKRQSIYWTLIIIQNDLF